MNDAAADRVLQVLVASVRPMIERYAKKYAAYWARMDWEELAAVGTEAALTAARRFDPKRGKPFESLARLHVVGAMRLRVRRERRETNERVDAAQDADLFEGTAERPSPRSPAHTPKEMHARAVQERRLHAHRMALTSLVEAGTIHAEKLILQKEETANAVTTINAVLASFSAQERQAFLLFHRLHMDQNAIAAALHISRSTVQRHVVRVVEAMKAAFVAAEIESRESVLDAWAHIDHVTDGSAD
ncbi:MAG: sigma-70 family RNA polymerase sigma factor [Polyangiaceae bacterium]